MFLKSDNEFVNGIKINIEQSFGNFQMPIRKNAIFLDEDSFIYLSGKHIIIHDLIRKR